ncbi:MAG: trigger factor [bacterium JZ-2024 1]
MKIRAEKIAPHRLQIIMEISREEMEKEKEKEWKRLQKTLTVSGFRPGKVPLSVVKNYFSDEEILEKTLNRTWREHLALFLKENPYELVGEPKTEMFPSDTGYTISTLWDVVPELEVGEVEGMKLEVPALPPVTEKDVEEEILQWRKNLGKIREVERPIVVGDFVTVVREGRSYTIEIPSEGIFHQRLVSRQIGDEVTLPFEDGEFPVRIEKVHEQVPLDEEEFLRRIQAKNMEEVSQKVREQLQRRRQQMQNELVQNALLAQLLRHIQKVSFPESLVQAEVESLREDVKVRFPSSEELEQYIHRNYGSWEKWEEKARERAIELLHLRHALDTIAKKKGIEVLPEELDQRIEETALAEGIRKELLRRKLTKTGNVDALEESVKRRKTLRWLLAHSQIHYQEVSR